MLDNTTNKLFSESLCIRHLIYIITKLKILKVYKMNG